MKNNGVVIPANVAAEQAVIGTVLAEGSIEDVAKILAPADFWDEEAAKVIESCLKLYNEETVINAKSLGISNSVFTGFVNKANSSMLKHNLNEVKNASLLRQLYNLADQVMKKVLLGQSYTSVMSDLESSLSNVKKRGGVGPRIVGLDIIMSNPRTYRLKFAVGSGIKSVDLKLEDMMLLKNVKQAIINKLDYLPILPNNASDWEKFMNTLLSNATKIEAPENADVEVEILESIRDMFDIRGEGKEASDLRTGSYALDEIGGKNYYLFQKTAVLAWLKQQSNAKLNTSDLWQLVSKWGGIQESRGKPLSKRIGSSSRTKLWALPEQVIQTGLKDIIDYEDLGWMEEDDTGN